MGLLFLGEVVFWALFFVVYLVVVLLIYGGIFGKLALSKKIQMISWGLILIILTIFSLVARYRH